MIDKRPFLIGVGCLTLAEVGLATLCVVLGYYVIAVLVVLYALLGVCGLVYIALSQ